MNPVSLADTSPTARILCRVQLNGYQRNVNARHEAFPDLAMNIVPNSDLSVSGVVIDVPAADMPALRQREVGYACVDITAALAEPFDTAVHTFIAPDVSVCEGKYVRQAYLDLCLGGVPTVERERWLLETIVQCPIRVV